MPDAFHPLFSASSSAATLFQWALVAALTVFIISPWAKKLGRLKSGDHYPVTDYFALSGVPHPKPLPNFDLNKARPRPYRPFRWKFNQTMSLAHLEHDMWIELESTYKFRVKQRQEIHAKRGDSILFCLPEAEAACQELMLMVIQFLCVRYPSVFSFDPRSNIFRNKILGSVQDTKAVDSALHFLLDNVPEDFLVVLKDQQTGFYHLKAAVSTSPIGFDLKEKLGKPLHEIHDPVPDYNEKMKPSMDRFFERVPTDNPVQRGSWLFEVGQPLYLMRDDPEFAVHNREDPNLDINDVHLRVNWQTLRRLPQSKAIAFNLKTFFTPVTQLRNEPYIPALISKVLKEAKESIKEYKGWSHLEHKLLPALDAYAEDQVASGLVPEGWEVRTLDEHPFYPGWNSKGEWDYL